MALSSNPTGGGPHPVEGAAGPAVPLDTAVHASGSVTWWTSIKQQMGLAQQQIQQNGQRMAARIRTFSREWKPPDLSKGLGMRVDVDILNPALTGLKQQWQQLPDPVKEVLPYAGVALAAGVSVQRLYSDQLTEAHQRYGHLRNDNTLLQQQFNQLQAQMDELQDRRSGAHMEIQMAQAVAQATTAAAAAAEAAAVAATACSSNLHGQHKR